MYEKFVIKIPYYKYLKIDAGRTEFFAGRICPHHTLVTLFYTVFHENPSVDSNVIRVERHTALRTDRQTDLVLS
jgi:16S rRNA A1518/A1519 N6-dimethyltransferase RsmA/KsgA/DIM1 with predicted DNA glycosylase/AP lyase activity